MGSTIAAIILAAGQGKRMRSRLPKVLHPIAGRPLLVQVIRLALARRCAPIVVVAPNDEAVRSAVRAAFPDAPLRFAVQPRRLGTADATRAGLAAIPGHRGRVLVLYGDVPLLRPASLARLERAAGRASLALLTAEVDAPFGYGRILRQHGHVTGVVEEKDATPAQRALREINVGVYLCDAALLRRAVGRVRRNNRQREAYLTDVVGLAARGGGAVAVAADPTEVVGVNSRAELARAEAILQRRLAAVHQARGVTLRDPGSTFLSLDARLGRDVVLGPGVQLEGAVRIAAGARIDGPTVLKDCTIGAGAVVHSFCHLEGAAIAAGASVGPFARLRPGAHLEHGARVGNFVEMKKARLGRGAKANHLTYLGDAEVGAGANVGAGTITCNYDGGPIKHPTRIGAGAFIGSNTTLVAPIVVGERAYVAAGSTLNQTVPAEALALGRARQVNKLGYAARLRRRLTAREKR